MRPLYAAGPRFLLENLLRKRVSESPVTTPPAVSGRCLLLSRAPGNGWRSTVSPRTGVFGGGTFCARSGATTINEKAIATDRDVVARRWVIAEDLRLTHIEATLAYGHIGVPCQSALLQHGTDSGRAAGLYL